MKVLFMTSRDITHPEWAGGDVYHFEVAKRLAVLGNEVTMLCGKYSGCENQEEMQGIKIMRIRGGFLRVISNLLAYQKHLRGRQDVIVEEAEGPAGPLFSFLYAKEPVVIMWHQLGKAIYLNQFPYPIALVLLIMEKIYVAAARKCNVIVPSTERAHEFERTGLAKEKIHVVPAAFVLDRKKRLNQNTSEQPYFLVLGKIRRYKAYHHAVEAMKLLRTEGEQCCLVVAGRRGEEKYHAELRRLVTKYDLDDSVVVRLNISEEEKTKLLAEATALIVTSPIEGFSIVSAEANGLGIPVIATNGVPDEVVRNGFNGIKYDFGDISALAKAMSKLLHDESLRNRLSANAIENSVRFSWDKSASLFKEVLQKTIRGKASNHGVPHNAQ
jgi:glycosyltransferase involved in cell wall biosynthesis